MNLRVYLRPYGALSMQIRMFIPVMVPDESLIKNPVATFVLELIPGIVMGIVQGIL
jgi:hypothetical protein